MSDDSGYQSGTVSVQDSAARCPDQLLGQLVGMVEEAAGKGGDTPSHLRLGVTLALSGSVVSGVLVDFQTWADAVCAQSDVHGLAPRAGQEGVDAGRPRESLRAVLGGSRSGLDGPGRRSNEAMIHLVDARVGLGGALAPVDRGVAWRGRLSHVSGWSFGTLNAWN